VNKTDLYYTQTQDNAQKSVFDVDILQWWRVHGHRFQRLAIIAKYYLSIQSSSAFVERVFSVAGNTLVTKRVSLGPNKLSKMIVLKSHEELLAEMMNI
jgi:hypothetical protein